MSLDSSIRGQPTPVSVVPREVTGADDQGNGAQPVLFQARQLGNVSIPVSIEYSDSDDASVSLIGFDGAVLLFGGQCEIPAETLAPQAFTAALAHPTIAEPWRLRIGRLLAARFDDLLGSRHAPIPSPFHREEKEEAPGLVIPDADAAGLTRTLDLEELGVVAAVTIALDISHARVSDLTVHLISASGSRVLLHNRAESAEADITRSWLTGMSAELSSLVGEPAAGPWRLEVVDHAEGIVGTLNQWRIRLMLNTAVLYDLKTLPPELRINWPVSPTVAHTILIDSIPEDGLRIEQDQTSYVIRANGPRLTVAASDVIVNLEDGFEIGHVFIQKSVKRVRFLGGRYGQIEFQVPASFDSSPEVWHEDWLVEDVLFHRVEVDTTSAPAGDRESAFVMRGKRIAVLRSQVHAHHYCVWVGGTGPGFQSEDIILAGNTFQSDGPEATVRIQPALRSVVVDNRMRNPVKHNYRVHDRSHLAFAARNTFVGGGVMLATQPEDMLGTVWLRENIFHQTEESLLGLDNPLGSRLRVLVAVGNTIFFADGTACFVCLPEPLPPPAPPPALPADWEVRDNTVLPFRPFAE